MADGGYDGDTLLGVYEDEETAEEEGRKWKRLAVFVDYSTYVVPVEIGADPVMFFKDEVLRG